MSIKIWSLQSRNGTVINKQPKSSAMGEGRGVWSAGLLLIFLGEILKLPSLLQPMSEDVWIYFHTAEGLLYRVFPYVDRPFAYPPYAVLWFLPPLVSRLPRIYSLLFSLEMVLVDLVLQVMLLGTALRLVRWARIGSARVGISPMKEETVSGRIVGLNSPLVTPAVHGQGEDQISPQLVHPALAAVLVYVLASVALRDVILARFDLIPTALAVMGTLTLVRGYPFLSGCLLSVGAGTKVFPAMVAIALAMAAWRQRTLLFFVAGTSLGVLPLAWLSNFLPWWNFAVAQAGRGMQVESLAASAIWFLHHVVGIKAAWVQAPGGFEIAGPIVSSFLPWSRALWLAVSLFSTWLAARQIARAPLVTFPLLVRAMIFPLLGFVSFALVLSPQFLIWLLPGFALLAARGARLEPGLFVLACGLTTLIFPTSQYVTGINFFQSSVLLVRNLILCYLWAKGARELLITTRQSHECKDSISRVRSDCEKTFA